MLKIAIVAGGDSGEYEVSMKSAKQVELNLDKTRFESFVIEIRDKTWFCRQHGNVYRVDKNDFSLAIANRKICFDAVFNAIHGTPGEDGLLQGYFELVGIPYTSCGVATSALTFNKSFCKNVVSSYGIFTAKSVHLFKQDKYKEKTIREHLALPVFVKPNNGGSSVGISKVNKWSDLKAALSKAFHEDREILAEEFVAGRELTCGVLSSNKKIISFPVTEIISKKEFFDFEAKYSDGLASEVVPAEIPENLASECKSISEFLYGRLNCKGVVRFDYIYTGRDFYFLEVNTVPGLSAQSIVPKMTSAYGWSVTELFTLLIEECMKK